MTTQNFTTPTTSDQSNWIQQLWQRAIAPIGNSPKAKENQSTVQDSAIASESKANIRSSESAMPPAVIGTQALKAFSDRADEYEPADLALTDLIPADLARLNISPTQPAALSTKITTYQTESALIEIANTATATEEFDCESDDEYLAVLASAKLPELSEEIEQTLPDLLAF